MEVLQRFECLTCGAVHEGDTPPEQRKCCKNPDLKLLEITCDKDIDYKVELGKAYEDIIKLMKCYLDLPEEHYKFIAIWIVGTYFHSQFSTYPFLFFNAMRGSGKTRLLKFISSLGAKGDGSVQNDISESVLFRTPQGTTLCIDECERIGSKEKSTLRELLNSAYKRGVKVKRMRKSKDKDGENFVVEEFEPFIPIAMANINGLDEILEDRSISVVIEKSNDPKYTKKIEDFDANKTFSLVKKSLEQSSVVCVVYRRKKNITTAWNEYIDDVYNYTNNTNNNNNTNNTNNTTTTPLAQKELELFNKIDKSEINGRNFELLFPLLLVANEISDDVMDEILEIGVNLIKEKKSDESNESVDVSLIEFISQMEEETRFNYLPIKSILSGFRHFLGEGDTEDSWLNSKWLGKALKRLNLISDKKRLAGGIEVVLNIDKAKDKMRMFK